jgi:hypothetical protein
MNSYKIENGNCLEVIKNHQDEIIDACITDPPYGMGMEFWDHSVPSVDIWKEIYRVLKPGSFCLAFCSPQLYHRLALNIEDAGFKIQDQIMWMSTTKMPKVNKLKPAHEPIVVAQKLFSGTIESNFNKYGVGKIDIESVRIPWDKEPPKNWVAQGSKRRTFGKQGNTKGGADYHDFLYARNTKPSTTNPQKYFRINSTGGIEIVNNAYTTNILTLTDAGVLSTPGGGTSDRRVKNNIQYIYEDVLPTINQLKPVSFEFKNNPDVTRHGFIAQDVLPIKPELVLGDGDKPNGTYGLDYDGILALTVKALQEATNRIEKLEKELENLKNRL